MAKVLNQYIVDEMLKSDIEINYDSFYKDDLVLMITICRDKYKKAQEIINKTLNYLDNGYLINTKELKNMLKGDVCDEQ